MKPAAKIVSVTMAFAFAAAIVGAYAMDLWGPKPPPPELLARVRRDSVEIALFDDGRIGCALKPETKFYTAPWPAGKRELCVSMLGLLIEEMGE